MGPGAVRLRAGVPGDDEGNASPTERQHGPKRRVDPVRVHEIGVRAGRPQRGDRGGVAAAGHGNVVRADPGEPVHAVRLGGSADGDPDPSGDQTRGQRPYVRAAARASAAEHLHGAQRRLAVR